MRSSLPARLDSLAFADSAHLPLTLRNAVFNHVISFEGDPVANQLASGRCWLFALCNVVRLFTTRKYKLSKFQLSQVRATILYDETATDNDEMSRAIFSSTTTCPKRTGSSSRSWISLTRSSTRARCSTSCPACRLKTGVSPSRDLLRTERRLKDLPLGRIRPGQWDLAVSLVENFGLVPQHVYPESWNSSNSNVIDTLLTSKLREMGLQLRRYYRDLDGRRTDPLAMARHEKEKMVSFAASGEAVLQVLRELPRRTAQIKVIYRILTISLGTPPRPDEPVRLNPDSVPTEC